MVTISPKVTVVLIVSFLGAVFVALHMQRSYILSAFADGEDSDGESAHSRNTIVEVCPQKERNYIASSLEPAGMAPCGEVCTYEGTVISKHASYYPEILKAINCPNIMRRMAFKNHTIVFPPPDFPPVRLYDEFTMFGDMPVMMYNYFKGSGKEDDFKAHAAVFTENHINRYLSRHEQGESLNPYDNGRCVQDMIKKNAERFVGKRGVVIGTLAPWLESILLANGVSHVTTLEYSDLSYIHPQLDSYTPYDFAEKFLKGEVAKFDFAASFSSIEHAGLGRYTDPINPYGDLEAMAQVWCMLEPAAPMVLGVRYDNNQNYITWNIDRVYGDERLQYLTANWKVEEKVTCEPHVSIMLTRQD